MKKISKILFALTLIFILNINVKAVTITTDNTKQGVTDTNSYLVTNKGNITINNVGTDYFKGYKIIDYYYNSTANSLSYEFTDDFKTFLATTTDYKTLTVAEYRNLTSGNTTNGSTQTTSTLDTLMSQYANYIDNCIYTDIMCEYEEKRISLTTSNSTATGNTEIGSYLILPNSANKLYAVMVGNIDLEYDNNNWTVQNSTIVAKASSSIITKNIIGATKNNEKFFIKTGLEYTYKIDITIPEYPTNSTDKNFNIVEYLKDSTSSFSNNAMKFVSTISDIIIKIDNTQLSITNTSSNEGKLLNGTKEIGEITLNEGTSNSSDYPYFDINIDTSKINSDNISIEYKAILNNNDNIIGKNGNKAITRVKIPFAYSSERSGNSGRVDMESTIYSYGIKINTKDKTNNNLTGAEYKLYSDATLNTEVGSFTTNESVSTINGLAPGTYYVKQTSAPNGSNSINNETFTVNLEDSQEGYLELNVTNATGLFPVTGSIGTLLFGIVGLLVIVGAIAYYKVNQKKKLNSFD